MTEHQLQAAFVQWCRLNESKYPALKLAFAVPNGGARNMVVAKKLKAEGVRPGVPDWYLPVPRTVWAGLWIEFKRKPNKLTKSQQEYMAGLRHHGHMAVVCHELDEAIEAVKNYFE